jgi:hypothetical protein
LLLYSLISFFTTLSLYSKLPKIDNFKLYF